MTKIVPKHFYIWRLFWRTSKLMLDVLTVQNLQMKLQATAERRFTTACSVKGGEAQQQQKPYKKWNSSRQGVILEHNILLNFLNLGGGFKYFWFSPLLGKVSHFGIILANMFQRGWFNHQLVNCLMSSCEVASTPDLGSDDVVTTMSQTAGRGRIKWCVCLFS